MKLLMYGVNKETVTKEDVEKYLLDERRKQRQINHIHGFTGVKEIAVLTNDYRSEYYLYVDESAFSHGDFLRYIAKETDKTLQEVILETYSKFNEDVLRHLFEMSTGYLAEPRGSFAVLASVEKALSFSRAMNKNGKMIESMFKQAIQMAYYTKLNDMIQPLNNGPLSKYVYLLQDNLNGLEKKNYLISGNDFEVTRLTKLLLYAGAQTVTIIQKNEEESLKQFDKVQSSLTDIEATKVFPMTKKSLYYRLSKTDVAILNTDEIDLFDEDILSEVSIIRQTKKLQYLIDTCGEPPENLDYPALDVKYINGATKVSFNDEEQNNALVAFDEKLSDKIEQFMAFFEDVKADEAQKTI